MHTVPASLLLCIALLSLSLSQDPEIKYAETPLPNISTIHETKENGYVWPIAIIGTFSLSQSYTGPCIR